MAHYFDRERRLHFVFEKAMKNEGQIITNWRTKKEYKVFFRNSTDRKLRIFYEIEKNIKVGDVVQYKNKFYLVLTQEFTESNVYYRSDMIQCNAHINILSSGKELFFQIYTHKLKDGTSQGGVVNTVSGNMEMWTTDDEHSRQVKPDDVFNMVDTIGGAWKVLNVIWQDGIAKVFTVRDLATKPWEYYLSLSLPVYPFVVNNVYPALNHLARIYNPNLSTYTTVTNATITWQSSNPDVAEIDNITGEISAWTVGTTTITATWEEHNIIATIDIEIEEDKPLNGSLDFMWSWVDGSGTPTFGDKSIKTGQENLFTVIPYDNRGIEVTDISDIVFVISYSWYSTAQSNQITRTPIPPNKVKIKASSSGTPNVTMPPNNVFNLIANAHNPVNGIDYGEVNIKVTMTGLI